MKIDNSAVGTTLFGIAQILMPVIVALLIPWGSWVTYRVICFEEWKNISPRFTDRDAVALEVKVKSDMLELLDKRFQILDTKMDLVRDTLGELKSTLREHINKDAGKP